MTTSGTSRPSSWPEPPLRPCPTLRRLLRLAGARREHKVCVTGPQGLAALLSLHALGFPEACYILEGAVGCGDGPCDVLLLTGPMDRGAMASALDAALPRLKDGGVLAAHESSLEDDALIVSMLAAADRVAGWLVHDLAGSCCLVALQVNRTGDERLLRAA